MNRYEVLTGSSLASDLKVAFLKKPEAYPFAIDAVKMIETHMSWVFLTGEYVFKLKKPIRLEMLDFSTLDARYKNSLDEVRLNQRLAKDVYLGIVAITALDDGKMELDGNGTPIDWLVWMKRLPGEKMLDEAIRNGTVNQEELKTAAGVLTDFYLKATPIEISAMTYVNWITKCILNDRRRLLKEEYGQRADVVNGIADGLINFIYRKLDLLEARAENKRIIEAHGDLRPEHICLGPQPYFIDCLEFSRSLRILDIAEELAFLSLECDVLGQPWVGEAFLNTYRASSGDEVPDELISFYKAKKAFLRARISIRHITSPFYKSGDRDWEKICAQYLAHAASHVASFASVR